MAFHHLRNHASELSLAREVRYLHDLWKQGPPRNPNPSPNPNPNPNTNPRREEKKKNHSTNPRREEKKKNHSTNPRREEKKKNCIINPNPNLRPSNSTPFKKETKKKPRRNKNKKKDEGSDPPVSDVEWPCEPLPEPQPESGWPALKPHGPGPTRPATAEEQAKLAAIKLQQNGLNLCQDFFSKNVSSDGEEEDTEEEDLMEEDEDEGDSEDFKFFLGLFSLDGDLRGYYEKNWERGEFFCLVCGGIKVKFGKRFGNCTGLVQHANAISRTKRRAAHRAFGRVVCRVLGWDMNRLPSIVLDLGQPLGQSLAKDQTQEEVKEDSIVGQEEDVQKEIVESTEATAIQEENVHKEIVQSVETAVIQEENVQKEIVESEEEAVIQDDVQKEIVESVEEDIQKETVDPMDTAVDPDGYLFTLYEQL